MWTVLFKNSHGEVQSAKFHSEKELLERIEILDELHYEIINVYEGKMPL